MSKDTETLLEHVLEAIERIENYTENTSKEEFKQDVKTQDAVIRRLEIVGEAIKKLPEDFKEDNRESIWEGAAGMRDILIHQYFGVDLDIIWNTINQTLPELKENIKEVKKS
ncbi:MAG: DUF86 domain-containing protein [Candidatus Nanohalobium sp.]